MMLAVGNIDHCLLYEQVTRTCEYSTSTSKYEKYRLTSAVIKLKYNITAQ